MNQRLTHTLVGIVTAVLIVAAVAFSLGVTAPGRTGTGATAARLVLPLITHPSTDRMAECARCHVPGLAGRPPNHATYSAGTCLTCHRGAPLTRGNAAAGQERAEVPQVRHPVAAPYDDCVGCHAIGDNLSMPVEHADYGNDVCLGCHAAVAENGPDRATRR